MTATRSRTPRILLLVLVGLLGTLAGCGQTGPLTLPGAADQGTDGGDSADGTASADDEEGQEENEQR